MTKKQESKLVDGILEHESKLFVPAKFDEKASEMTGYSNYSYWRSTFRVFVKNKTALFLLIFLGVLLAFTIIQPYIPGQHNANKIFFKENGLPNSYAQSSSEFWFGTNNIGQDLWSRVWQGARTSLLIGLAVGIFECGIGIIIGALWGYVRKLDAFMTEIYNVLNNIPTTVLLMLLGSVVRPGISTMIIIMSATGWMGMARLIRNQIIIIRDREYNLASRCLGTPTRRIITKNLLPYIVSVLMLSLALSIPSTIGWEVFLTYIGLGIPKDIPSLGNLIDSGRTVMMNSATRNQLLNPAIVLSAITVSFYVLGNAFSDAADPRNHV